jgi:outer membrane protein, heavy metal efflux system
LVVLECSMKTRLTLALLCGAAATGALLTGGCAGAKTPLDPAAPFEEVRSRIDQRTSMDVEWPRDEESRERVRREVARILTEETFDAETAVQVALLNNPRLRAQFEEIGIAHAGVVQAGLMSNPRMSLTAKFPDGSPHRPKIEFPFVQNVVELYLIPKRRRVAKDMLKQAMLRTSDGVIALGQQVREAYYELAAARQVLEIERRALVRAAEVSDRAGPIAEQGRMADLELRRVRATEQAQRLRVALAQVEVQTRREALRELLGLTASRLSWREEPDLPPLPPTEPDLAILEIKGLEQRFDVELARQDVQLVDHAMALTRRSFFPAVNLGIAIERDRDRTLLIGPKLALELPVFDQQQGKIVRLTAQARQSRELYEAQIDRALAEIRTARGQFIGARRTAEFYQSVILPMRGELTEAAHRQQAAAAIDVDDLLLIADEQLRSERAATLALRDYWIARARLERAAACDLDSLGPADGPLSWLRWAPDELSGRPEHQYEFVNSESPESTAMGDFITPVHVVAPVLTPEP